MNSNLFAHLQETNKVDAACDIDKLDLNFNYNSRLLECWDVTHSGEHYGTRTYISNVEKRFMVSQLALNMRNKFVKNINYQIQDTTIIYLNCFT